MIEEQEIWAAALVMVSAYGDEAMLEAGQRAAKHQEEGDWLSAIVWHRILDAIERLQAKTPSEGEMVH